MALQVAEQNIDEKELIVAGIEGNGQLVAQCLIDEIQKIVQTKTTLITLCINKKSPGEAHLSEPVSCNNKVIILVDDVANTGRTLLYALKPLLNSLPKKIQTLVLVERSHKMFPIQTDYSGLSISTTLQEHIQVDSVGNILTAAWLF
ncbi:MAG: phosphoribosyltransferase domain-containing protein [Flavisolibacter sp.]